jgi:hypothetical protein
MLDVSITVSDQTLIETGADYLGFTYDSNNLHFRDRWLNFSDTSLRESITPFAGATVRIGGTRTNHALFSFNGTARAYFADGTVPGINDTVIDANKWLLDVSGPAWTTAMYDNGAGSVGLQQGLYDFAQDLQLKLVLQLNAFGVRYPNKSWAPENTQWYLDTLTKSNASTISTFEFGNEAILFNLHDHKPFVVYAAQEARDTHRLREMINTTFREPATRPLLQGPDSCCSPTDQEYLGSYLSDCADALDQISVHHYPGACSRSS